MRKLLLLAMAVATGAAFAAERTVLWEYFTQTG